MFLIVHYCCSVISKFEACGEPNRLYEDCGDSPVPFSQ